MKLTIATCQFPISVNIRKNFQYISCQMRQAKNHKADVVHFPECALSGYAGPDFKSYNNFNWQSLRKHTLEALNLASQLKLWLVLGTTHQLTGNHKPHNSLLIINDKGKIIDRYDKMFCAGNKNEDSGDLAHYTSGNHFTVFKIKSIKCGALICHDYRYPELYREYKRQGVQLMFHSYHAGGISLKQYKKMQKYVSPQFAKFSGGETIPEITMPATMRSYAANNFVWISCPNSSRPQSCWPSFFVRPDGIVTGQLRRNVTGLLVSKLDTNKKLYDSTITWRNNAMNGIFHSGTLVNDPRSKNKTAI